MSQAVTKIKNEDYKIMIVDDRPEIRLLLRHHIDRWFDMQIIEAEDGNQAMELLCKTNGIVLILLDIMMPGLDGVETAKRIKEDYPNRNFKVCMVTAKDDEQTVRQLLLQGVDDYVVKPIDEEILRTKLLDLMKRDFDFSRPPFATIPAEVSGTILNLNQVYKQATFKEFSEYHAVLVCETAIMRESVLVIDSRYFNRLFGAKINIYLKVVLCHKLDDERFKLTCVFIALHENLRKKIRTLSIRGQKVLDG